MGSQEMEASRRGPCLDSSKLLNLNPNDILPAAGPKHFNLSNWANNCGPSVHVSEPVGDVTFKPAHKSIKEILIDKILEYALLLL